MVISCSSVPAEFSALEHLVRNARDEVLLTSRKHCHAKNVTSIVVSSYNGRLLRAFLAWPGNQLFSNRLDSARMAVGIHDHKYNIRLSKIYGDVFNTTYEVRKNAPGRFLHEWKYRSGNASGPGVLSYVGGKMLAEKERVVLDDEPLFLAHDIPHSVHCYGQAAWWVNEGEVQKSSTTLFTVSQAAPSFEGLYIPFESAEEVREHVREFIERTT